MYQVDYLVKDKEKYEKEGPKAPKFIVGKDFNDVLEEARKHETDNLSLYDVRLSVNDEILLTKKCKGNKNVSK